ncbi:hypothetical protein ABPG75_009702 [Micractinium tetrahymenae]
MDFYKILGVAEDASPAEIKAAYRRQAFQLHPDTNPDAGPAARARFHELQEAYSILRDEGRRAQYDRMRATGFAGGAADFEAGGAAGGYGMPWGQPSMDARDFDKAFEEWWKKMSDEFQDYEEQQFARERMSAERMARAAAWEWEKREAKANKVRVEKLKWRTEEARLQRHASVLRRFWQTHSGFTLADALVAGLFLAGAAGVAWTWKGVVREARQQQQGQGQQYGQQQGQEQPGSQGQRQQRWQAQEQPQPAGLPAAAAAAVAAAAQSPT